MSASRRNANRQIQNQFHGQINRNNNFLGRKRENNQNFPEKKHYNNRNEKYSNNRYQQHNDYLSSKKNNNTKPLVSQDIKDIKSIKAAPEKSNNKLFISKVPSQVNNLNNEKEKKKETAASGLISESKNEIDSQVKPFRIEIGGIETSVSENELKILWEKCGEIININIIRNETDSSQECKCYIDFKRKESIEAALKLSGTIIKGKKIIINKYFENIIRKEEKQKSIHEMMEDMKSYINNGLQNIQNKFQDEINSLKKELRQQKINLGLTNEIINQTEKFYNKKNEHLTSKINCLTNSFKVLYFRKLSNLIFNKIIEKYKEKLATTPKIFGENGKEFDIIVAKENIENIDKYKLNLLFDFLRYIKGLSSKIVHFKGNEGINVQKEIFYDLINIKEKKMKNFSRKKESLKLKMLLIYFLRTKIRKKK